MLALIGRAMKTTIFVVNHFKTIRCICIAYPNYTVYTVKNKIISNNRVKIFNVYTKCLPNLLFSTKNSAVDDIQDSIVTQKKQKRRRIVSTSSSSADESKDDLNKSE